MKLTKFNPKDIQSMYDSNHRYNVMLKNGTVLNAVAITEWIEDETEKVYYLFDNLDGDTWEPNEVQSTDICYLYDVVEVGNQYALTRNGSKCFPENIYGTFEHYSIAQNFANIFQYYQDTYTPDTIKEKDIIEYTDKHGVHKGIVLSVKKPIELDDHGSIELYVFDEKQFEHFTYIAWNKHLTVVEEY